MYTITLGPKANIFHDASTGITVAKGEKVELRDSQYKSAKIRQALATGHLRIVTNEEKVEVISTEDITKLDKKIKSNYKKGVTINKLAENISIDQAKELAKKNKVEVDKNDTVVSILEAILDEDES